METWTKFFDSKTIHNEYEIEYVLQSAKIFFPMLFSAMGENSDRNGLVNTHERIIKHWLEATWGSRVSEKDFADEILTIFESNVPCDEMIMVKNISFVSHCEHHLLPFFGKVTIAYLPDITDENTKLLGLSKFARLVDYWSARLQTQERLTYNLGNFIEYNVPCTGCAVYINATHTCMSLRGVKSMDCETETHYLTGPFKDNPTTKSEFMSHCK